MPKQKTRSTAVKRYRVTANGHFKRKKANTRHILTKKSTKRKRIMRQGALLNKSFEKRMRIMLSV
jgi:large subunit ribosomal protein L35